MRVLLAGGTGVIGKQLVPLLTAVGHELFVLTRGDQDRVDHLAALGARPVIGDLLDPAVVTGIVRQAQPEAIVHMATAIPRELNPKRQPEQFAVTNRLRTEGLRNLVNAAEDVSPARLVVQGLAYAYDPATGGIATEDAPLWAEPPAQFRTTAAALIELESITRAANGLVLRFGHLYGPGTFYAPDGSFTAQVRAGKVPLVGGGASTFSFVHTRDAATAVLAALDKPVTGALNIVDDEPAPMSEWLVEFASLLGARKPKSIPTWVARLAVGAWGAAYMTQLLGASNERAKIELDWKPRYSSWRAGFAEEHRRLGAL
ncbi:MAG TPA: NAD(P)-dependent oxidoreductase [Jatrophihabitans sp.]